MPIDRCDISPGVRIGYPDLVNLYGCRIGAESSIGPFVEIQAGCSIGSGCKVSSHSFLCEGVTLEDGVFIGHGVMFTNDMLPRATDGAGQRLGAGDWDCLPTLVQEGASIGSNATILCGLKIGAHAMIGAGAVVTADVAPFAIMAGVPARQIGDMRQRAAAAAAAQPATAAEALANADSNSDSSRSARRGAA